MSQILGTCPDMTLAVEKDVKQQLVLSSRGWKIMLSHMVKDIKSILSLWISGKIGEFKTVRKKSFETWAEKLGTWRQNINEITLSCTVKEIEAI